MATVVDLYTPRIAAEQQERESKRRFFAETMGSAAKELFQYSINKQLIDKAYAEIEANAKLKLLDVAQKEKQQARENLGKQLNATAFTLAAAPEMASEEAKGKLESELRDYTGTDFAFPRDPNTGKITIPDNLLQIFKVGFLDEHGMPNLQGYKTLAEINAPMSDIGKLINDYQKLKKSGIPDEDPQMQGLLKKITAATDFPDPVRRIIDKDIEAGNWGDAWRKVLELHAAGAPKAGDVKIVTPSAESQERLLIAGQARTKLAEVRAAWDKVKVKNADWLNPATGIGAETLNNIWSRMNWSDPDVTEFQKRVNEFEAIQIRLMAGLNQTAQEAMRTKGYLINNQLPMGQFETTLKLNQNWADQNYDDRWFMTTVLGGTGEPKGVAAPPPPSGPRPLEKPTAAKENQGTQPKNAPPQAPDVSNDPSLKASRAEQERLRKKAQQKLRRERPTGGGDAMPQSPQSMLFLRNLERYNAIV
jgi:hypothetical protein